MPIKYPRGSYIVRDGERRKVLEELGDLRFLSWAKHENLDWEQMASVTQKTAFEIERDGWKAEEDAKAPEPWKPEDDEMFFFVTDAGDVDGYKFCSLDGFDVEYVTAGNYYRTREEAEKAAERVRKAYRG
jgi:hypothetical protein